MTKNANRKASQTDETPNASSGKKSGGREKRTGDTSKDAEANPVASTNSPTDQGADFKEPHPNAAIRAKTDTEIESAYRLAKLAAQLMAHRGPTAEQLKREPLGLANSKWDKDFEGALKRAQMLMDATIRNDTDIHAYQIFPEGKDFTAEGIMLEFRRAGWPGLKSKQPVIDLMGAAKVFFEERGWSIHDQFPLVDAQNQQMAWTKIRRAFEDLRESPDVIASFPNFDEAATRFTDCLFEPQSRGLDNRPVSEALENSFWFTTFLGWCFIEQSSKEGGVTTRRYRPHEIFRFAADQGWNSEKLIKTRSELASDFIPFPQQPSGGIWSSQTYPVFHEKRGNQAFEAEFCADPPSASPHEEENSHD